MATEIKIKSKSILAADGIFFDVVTGEGIKGRSAKTGGEPLVSLPENQAGEEIKKQTNKKLIRSEKNWLFQLESEFMD